MSSGPRIVRTCVIELFINLGNMVARFVLIGMLLPHSELGIELHQACVAGEHEFCGGILCLRHVLQDLRHAPAAWHKEIAFVFMQLASEQGKQARFARAIAADQSYFFSGLDDGAAIRQQHFGCAAQRDVFERNHREKLRGCARRCQKSA